MQLPTLLYLRALRTKAISERLLIRAMQGSENVVYSTKNESSNKPEERKGKQLKQRRPPLVHICWVKYEGHIYGL
jgi:hypothetical protein